MTTRQLVPENHVIVVFGANGDLARRKLLPALFHLDQEGLMPEDYLLVGNSRSELTDEEFREFARLAVDEFCRCKADDESWERFSSRLSYVSQEFKPGDTEPLKAAVRKAEAQLGGQPRRLFYLAVPPVAFATITEGLADCGLTERARVVFEKPFGTDLDSFSHLNDVVQSVLDESQIYRIDHFLGKESVQNILALRFANGMFEPIWNRNHIDHVQIDVPEELGIGTRAGFYEKTGAMRDMVVTHLLQVLSFVALEPPGALTPKALIDEKVKVFEAMVPLQRDDIVFGQYEGYLDVDGVARESRTETFVAARVFIDNWRWSGVPFYLRTGKRLAESRQTITLAFRRAPGRFFSDAAIDHQHNRVSIELGRDERVSVAFLAKSPGPTIQLAPARMDFAYQGSFGSDLVEAYERLIHDALLGDPTLFTRPDGIEQTWEVAASVIADPPAVETYAAGSWGPQAIHELIAPRRWQLPDEQSRRS